MPIWVSRMIDFRHENHPGLEPGSRDLGASVAAPDRVLGAGHLNRTVNVTERTQAVHRAYRAVVQQLRGADHA